MLTLELFGILAIAIAGAVIAAMIVAGASVVILALSGLVKSVVQSRQEQDAEEVPELPLVAES